MPLSNIQNSLYLWPLALQNLQPLPFRRVSWMYAMLTFLSDYASTTSPALPASESTFQVPTRNCQPFHSPSALRSSFTQPCALARGCAAFQLGFPTFCLHRHVGAPTGWNQNIISLFAIFWIFCSKVKITKADAPTIRMDCHPILTNWRPNLCHPHHFTPDALPSTTLPIHPGLGQAPNMLACISGG